MQPVGDVEDEEDEREDDCCLLIPVDLLVVQEIFPLFIILVAVTGIDGRAG